MDDPIEKYINILRGDGGEDALLAELKRLGKQGNTSARRTFWKMKSALADQERALDVRIRDALGEE